MNDQELVNLISISTFAMFGLAMTIIILFNISQKRILTEQKEAFKLKLAFKNDLISNQIETQETERARIAQELHDDIGSKLNVIKLNMRLLKSINEKNENPQKVLDSINIALNNSIQRTREISHDLMPPGLIKFGLRSALNSLVISINKSKQIRLDIHMEQEWKNLSKKHELHIYRIIQELTTNTIKHAKANNIEITLQEHKEKRSILYKDNGIGIKNKADYDAGLGIANIASRCHLLNADFKLHTLPTTGFQFEISILN